MGSAFLDTLLALPYTGLQALMQNRLPGWLRPTHSRRTALRQMEPLLNRWAVNTVCQSARCPNLGECFSSSIATFLLLGDRCTRRCRFCAVEGGRPLPPDPEEPARVAGAASELGIRHVVLTSVTRDDLPDGGASHFAATIQAVRQRCGATIEALVPDFEGDLAALQIMLDAAPEIIAHNIETVSRLYPTVRPQGNYRRALQLLSRVSSHHSPPRVKSGLMVGLGETEDEVRQAMGDLRRVGVEILTIGQYLRPGPGHLPVVEYVRPEVYARYQACSQELGFLEASCAPLVRSSYHAALPSKLSCGAY